MLRRVFAVIIGLVIGSIVFMVIQSLIAQQYPPPEDFNVVDKEAFMRYWQSLPTEMFMKINGAMMFGAFIAGCVCTMIKDKFGFRLALIVGVVFAIFSITYMTIIFVPKWLYLTNPLGTLLGAVLGYYLTSKLPKRDIKY